MNDETIKIVVGLLAGLITEFARRRVSSGKSNEGERAIIAVANELEECQEQVKNLRELVAKYKEWLSLSE